MQQGSAPVLRSGSVHPPQWLCYGGRATEGGLHPHRLRRGRLGGDGFEKPAGRRAPATRTYSTVDAMNVRSCPDLGPDLFRIRTECCHPAGVGGVLKSPSGSVVSLNCRLPSGIAPGCAVTGRRKPPKTRGSFNSQDTDYKWVIAHDCPEIGGGGERKCGNLKIEIVVRTSEDRGQRGEDEGRGVSFVPDGTGAGVFRTTHRWKRWAIIGRPCGTSAAGKAPPPSSYGGWTAPYPPGAGMGKRE